MRDALAKFPLISTAKHVSLDESNPIRFSWIFFFFFDFLTARLLLILVPIHSHPMSSEIISLPSFAQHVTTCLFMHAIYNIRQEDEYNNTKDLFAPAIGLILSFTLLSC